MALEELSAWYMMVASRFVLLFHDLSSFLSYPFNIGGVPPWAHRARIVWWIVDRLSVNRGSVLRNNNSVTLLATRDARSFSA